MLESEARAKICALMSRPEDSAGPPPPDGDPYAPPDNLPDALSKGLIRCFGRNCVFWNDGTSLRPGGRCGLLPQELIFDGRGDAY